jgi:hypothetical protein
VTSFDMLVQFGVTGAIGPVRIDSLLTEIGAEFGPPVDLGRVTKRRRWPHRFGYGDLELCVCSCRRVRSFAVYTHRASIELPQRDCDAGPALVHPPGRQIGRAELRAALDAVDCVLVECKPTAQGQETWRTPGTGVAFTFIKNRGDGTVLVSASVWGDDHACPPVSPGTPEDGFGLAQL